MQTFILSFILAVKEALLSMIYTWESYVRMSYASRNESKKHAVNGIRKVSAESCLRAIATVKTWKKICLISIKISPVFYLILMFQLLDAGAMLSTPSSAC